MPKTPTIKSRDELIRSGIRMYKNMQQYREKVLSGELTEDDIRRMAADWADKQIEKRSARIVEAKQSQEDIKDDEEKYREKQRKAYKKAYDWNDANDAASLEQLINLELEIRAINRDIENTRDLKVKNSHRNTLTKVISEHRQLQKDLKIDRESREKKRDTKSVIDDWDRIKFDAAIKIKELNDEFAKAASDSKTEAELRDRMKYHGVIPFNMVDTILYHHRRVLGLDTTIEKS